MYQLVSKKKKTILLGIVGLLLIFSLTKEFFSALNAPTPVSKQIDEFAKSIAERCPLVVDSITTLRNCAASSGNKILLNYQLSIDKEGIDTVSLISNCREEMLNRIKTDPSMAFFKDNEVAFNVSYYDIAGNYICRIIVSTNDSK